MSTDNVPKVRWWSWALDSVFFIVGGAYLLQGQLTWGLALIGFGVLAVAFDLWRRRLTRGGEKGDEERETDAADQTVGGADETIEHG